MAVDDRTLVVMEANGGVEQALVDEVLRTGAKRAYAARTSQSLAEGRRNGAAHTLKDQNGMFVQAAPIMS